MQIHLFRLSNRNKHSFSINKTAQILFDCCLLCSLYHNCPCTVLWQSGILNTLVFFVERVNKNSYVSSPLSIWPRHILYRYLCAFCKNIITWSHYMILHFWSVNTNSYLHVTYQLSRSKCIISKCSSGKTEKQVIVIKQHKWLQYQKFIKLLQYTAPVYCTNAHNFLCKWKG